MALPINIEDLLRRQKIEGNRIEFKAGWNPDAVYHSICAFANDFDNIGGGYIVIGVEEERGIACRPVKGLPVETVDGILKDMVGYNNKINPYYLPRPSVEEVDGKYILVIWVPAGVNRPYDVRESVISKNNPKSQWYIRSGSSSIVAKGEVLDELREMANRTPFDDRGNPDIDIDDISTILVYEHLRKIGSKLAKDFRNLAFEEILDKMDLYTGSRERRMLKNVAAMMFCENPRKFFPYAQVDIVIFPNGLEQNPNNMIEVPVISGPVPYMIRATLDYLRTNIIKERIIKLKDRAEAVKFFNYPYQALEEAVVNALYHRDYKESEPVEIRIEPSGISILSYSGPDRSISMESIRNARSLKARRYRNRRLGDFLKELELSEGRATGIPTIQDELRRNGSGEARIETDAERSYFLIEIPCREGFEMFSVLNAFSAEPETDLGMDGLETAEPEIGEDDKTEPETEPEIGADGKTEPETEPEIGVDGKTEPETEPKGKLKTLHAVMDIIASDPAVTIPVIAERCGKSRTTIQTCIRLLKEENRIERIGANKGGRWVIISRR